ncbi:MAG: PAS domain S-box protein [Gemmatimonadetes bacterium]|nr:PAS domain S-box protein [Gemmatimonadota bacterium]
MLHSEIVNALRAPVLALPGSGPAAGAAARLAALRISVLYLALAGLWVFGSPPVLGALLPASSGPGANVSLSGWPFLLLTALLVYLLVRHHLGRLEASSPSRGSDTLEPALFATDAEAVVVADAADGRVLQVNARAEALFGFAATELVGRALSHLAPPEDAERCWRAIQEDAQAGRFATAELVLRRKDGSAMPVEVLATPARVAGARVVQAIFRDISERKRLEERLFQSQKMEVVGRLAGGIAHDFNNVLTTIKGYTEFLIDDLDPRDPRREEVEEIRRAADRASALTRQLLAVSREQVLAPEVFDLNGVVSEMGKMLHRVLGEDIELRTELDPTSAPIRADRGQIEQVLLNLVVNARDAMPWGGKLSIRTASADTDPEGRGRGEVEGGRWVVLAVADTGEGMTPETLSHVFEPFFTTKEKGTGLGLSTAYGIVKQSGGHIWVYSEQGKGTTFKIYLPRVEHMTAEREAQVSAQLRGTETVLVVDDASAVRSVARRALEDGGYTVLEAENGWEATRLAREHGGPIHLLLTDVAMPDMGGRQLAERVVQSRPQLKVLYMSGFGFEAALRHGALDAGTPFLEKPFTPESLAFKLREVLDGPGCENGREESASGQSRL